MSYCRWSSLCGLCDVYAYESEDGYQIHLSSKRIMGPQPYVPYQELVEGTATPDEFLEAYKKYTEALHSSVHVDNNLPYGPISINCPDLLEFYYQMLELRLLGYLFPDAVIATILEELSYEA